jgi:hypothetical protein
MNSGSEEEGVSQFTVVVLASTVGLFGLCCIGFVAWHASRSSHLAKVEAANAQVADAIDSAKAWLEAKSSSDGDVVAKRLTHALENSVASEKIDGNEVLRLVRARLDATVQKPPIRSPSVNNEQANSGFMANAPEDNAKIVVDQLLSTPQGRSTADRLASKDDQLTAFQRAHGIPDSVAEAAIKEWVIEHGGNFDWNLEEVKAICLRLNR